MSQLHQFRSKQFLIAASALLAATVACSGPAGAPSATTAPAEVLPTATSDSGASSATTAPTDALPNATLPEPTTQTLSPRHAIIQSSDFRLMTYDVDGQSVPFPAKADFMIQPFVNQTGFSADTLYGLSGYGPGAPDRPRTYSYDPTGTHVLAFIPETAQRPAAWMGDGSHPAQIAWGEYPGGDQTPARLMIAGLDATAGTPAYEMPLTPSPLYVIPFHWSADGSHLYFSVEPDGLGGYILFGGHSSLWTLDTATGQSTELIPIDAEHNIICLEEFSPDETLLSSHCDKQISVIDLKTMAKTVITPPAEVPMDEVGQLGDVRFSPDGKRVAFALAHGDPSNEQGWVAVTDDLSGSSRLVLTSPAGTYYAVVGWFDNDHLLLSSFNPASGLSNLLLLPLDGSEPHEFALDVSFMTFVP